MSKEMMTQCRLRRIDGSTEVAYIESTYAQPGRSIGIKINGQWDDNWTVVESYDPPRPAAEVMRRERDWKTARRATDI